MRGTIKPSRTSVAGSGLGNGEGPSTQTVSHFSFRSRLQIPSRLTVLQTGEDFILGVVRDDLDVERVRLYRMEGTDE